MKLGKHNDKVKLLRKLLRSPAERAATGTFVLEGPKLLEEALRAGTVQWVVSTEELDIGADVYTAPASLIESISDAVATQGVLTVATLPAKEIAGGNLFVLWGVQDPGNVGAVIRVAEATGMGGVLLSTTSADPFGPKAVRASAGSVLRVPVVRIDELPELPLAAAVAHGGDDPASADLSEPVAFLLGGEGQGLPDEVASKAKTRLSLRMEGQVESLNVAVTAALLAYEARRQQAISSA